MTLIDKAEALLPCPFCGGEAQLYPSGGFVLMYAVFCQSCKAETNSFATEAAAIAAWNRRTALPARGVGVNVDAGIDALEAHLREIGYSDIPWREWPEKDQADVRAALRIAILAALAPTDAAQAREAALREALEACDYVFDTAMEAGVAVGAHECRVKIKALLEAKL